MASDICVYCGEEKPRADRASYYQDKDVCSWQCQRSQVRKEDITICLTDKDIASEVKYRAEKDIGSFFKLETLLFHICTEYVASINLRADQWWGVRIEGHWWFEGGDGTYEAGDEKEPSEYDAIPGFKLSGTESIGDRKFSVYAEPDNLEDGLIHLLGKIITLRQEWQEECAAWEKEHSAEIRPIAKTTMEHREETWSESVKHVPRQDYDAHMKRLDSYEQTE